MIPARVTSISIMMNIVDNFDDFELSDEDIEVYVEELNPMNESYVTDGGFTSIPLKEPEPVSVFRTFFTEEILRPPPPPESISALGNTNGLKLEAYVGAVLGILW